MEVKIIKNPITKKHLIAMAKEGFDNFVKAVVDTEQEIMAINGELHADEETILVEKEGSKRAHTWGINLYPDKSGGDYIEFDSMVNLKPAFNNRSRGVTNPETRKHIARIVYKLIRD